MCRPCTSMFEYSTKWKSIRCSRIHDKHPESVNGWSKAFWARGYYVATVGNLTEEAVKEYIQKQKEESKREDTGR